MFLLRLLSTVLVAICVILLATFEPVRVAVAPPSAPQEPAAPVTAADRDGDPPVAVIDVAPGVAPSDLAALLRLRPGEHVTAVDDREPSSDLAAGALIAQRAPRAGGFVDLMVSDGENERRVLMLLH